MARQDGSTATQQDQPPKEYKPETQAGFGDLNQAAFSDAWMAAFSPEDSDGGFLFDRDRGQWMEFVEGDRGGLWSEANDQARRTMLYMAGQAIQHACRGAEQPKKALAGARSKWLRTLHIKASLEMARWGRDGHRMTVSQSEFDRRGDVISQDDGRVIELQSGNIRRGEALDMISKRLAPGVRLFNGSGTSPKWERFVWESLGNYPESERPYVMSWLQRFVGYCLTAETKAEVFCFLHGPRGTGKSTFLETLSYILHDYGRRVDGRQLASDDSQHRQWLARLAGARLVTAPELPERGYWSTGDLNALVSGETILANYMRQNSFEFDPVCKVIVAGNKRPKADPENGIWRRVRLIDFSCKPATVDEGLKDSLKLEAAGILRWMVNGAVNYYKRGLADTPKTIEAATEDYRRDQDVLGDFIEDRLTRDCAGEVTAGELYESYRAWADDQGMTDRQRWSKRKLGLEMKARGFESKRLPHVRTRVWEGVTIEAV